MAVLYTKKRTPSGAGKWEDLATVGDVQRFFRWLILETKADKIDGRKAGVMGQLGLYLLRTLEVSDLDKRVEAIEKRLDPDPVHSPTEATRGTTYDTGNQITTY